MASYGKGWKWKNFCIVSALRRQCTWTYLKSFVYIKNDQVCSFCVKLLNVVILVLVNFDAFHDEYSFLNSLLSSLYSFFIVLSLFDIFGFSFYFVTILTKVLVTAGDRWRRILGSMCAISVNIAIKN